MKVNKKNKLNVVGNLSSTRLIAMGFLVVIFLGGLLLTLPFSSANGEWTNITDALFTATTSVCVTGLVTVSTATHWSIFGKIIILCLIQLGGLGVITVAVTALILLGKKITLKERILIQEAYNLDTLKGMVILIKRILKGTAVIEGIGACAYLFIFVPEYGLVKGICYSIFHSVSAFCNAGIDLIGENSLMPYVTNPLMNLITIFLIVSGGIGFTVLWDIYDLWKKERKITFRKLQLHSKLALVMTAALIVGGTVLFLALEYSNTQTIGNLNFFQKLLASLFQSVTTRTAGFASIDQAKLTQGAMLVSIVLMFIGGSPAGTAGGMKTTTLAVLLLTVRSMIKGRSSTEVFGRCIRVHLVRTALAVFVLGFTILIGGAGILCVSEGKDLGRILYETASALGTAGLSCGITSQLTIIGKCVVMCIMYIGRIGPITVTVALLSRKKNKRSTIELPEGKVIIG